jgi:hypothetical protein
MYLLKLILFVFGNLGFLSFLPIFNPDLLVQPLLSWCQWLLFMTQVRRYPELGPNYIDLVDPVTRLKPGARAGHRTEFKNYVFYIIFIY